MWISQCVCASIFVNSVRTAGPIGTGVPAIDAPIRRNDDSTDSGSTGGTWHVTPREGLQKVVDTSTGRTGGTADLKLAGHTYTTPTCVLLWLPFLWGAGCTRQGRKTFLTWDPPV